MEKGCEAVESKTQLAKLIELTNDKAKYDAQVKKISSISVHATDPDNEDQPDPPKQIQQKNPGNVIRF